MAKQPPKKATASAKVGKAATIKKKTRSMYDLENVHTGGSKTHPGIVKAQADKTKRDSVLAEYKKRQNKKK